MQHTICPDLLAQIQKASAAADDAAGSFADFERGVRSSIASVRPASAASARDVSAGPLPPLSPVAGGGAGDDGEDGDDAEELDALDQSQGLPPECTQDEDEESTSDAVRPAESSALQQQQGALGAASASESDAQAPEGPGYAADGRAEESSTDGSFLSSDGLLGGHAGAYGRGTDEMDSAAEQSTASAVEADEIEPERSHGESDGLSYTSDDHDDLDSGTPRREGGEGMRGEGLAVALLPAMALPDTGAAGHLSLLQHAGNADGNGLVGVPPTPMYVDTGDASDKVTPGQYFRARSSRTGNLSERRRALAQPTFGMLPEQTPIQPARPNSRAYGGAVNAARPSGLHDAGDGAAAQRPEPAAAYAGDEESDQDDEDTGSLLEERHLSRDSPRARRQQRTRSRLRTAPEQGLLPSMIHAVPYVVDFGLNCAVGWKWGQTVTVHNVHAMPIIVVTETVGDQASDFSVSPQFLRLDPHQTASVQVVYKPKGAIEPRGRWAALTLYATEAIPPPPPGTPCPSAASLPVPQPAERAVVLLRGGVVPSPITIHSIAETELSVISLRGENQRTLLVRNNSDSPLSLSLGSSSAAVKILPPALTIEPLRCADVVLQCSQTAYEGAAAFDAQLRILSNCNGLNTGLLEVPIHGALQRAGDSPSASRSVSPTHSSKASRGSSSDARPASPARQTARRPPPIALPRDPLVWETTPVGLSSHTQLAVQNVSASNVRCTLEIEPDRGIFAVEREKVVGTDCTALIPVVFAPPVAGRHEARLLVSCPGMEGPLVVPLSAAAETSAFSTTTARLDFGSLVVGRQCTRTFDVRNDSDTVGAALTVAPSGVQPEGCLSLAFAVRGQEPKEGLELRLAPAETVTVAVTAKAVKETSPKTTTPTAVSGAVMLSSVNETSADSALLGQISMELKAVVGYVGLEFPKEMRSVVLVAARAGTRTVAFVPMRNCGSLPLPLDLCTDHPDFSVTPPSATLPPMSILRASVTYNPRRPGMSKALLLISTTNATASFESAQAVVMVAVLPGMSESQTAHSPARVWCTYAELLVARVHYEAALPLVPQSSQSQGLGSDLRSAESAQVAVVAVAVVPGSSQFQGLGSALRSAVSTQAVVIAVVVVPGVNNKL
eukprot:m51a1_g556 hypothetical protein (1123) ;mRNA; r:469420-479445